MIDILFGAIIVAALLWMAWKQWGHLTKINPLATIKDWWAARKAPRIPGEQTAPTLKAFFDATSGDATGYRFKDFKPYSAAVPNQGVTMNKAELFNESGIRLTQMDSLLAEATAKNRDPAVQVPLSAAHKLVGENGKALADLYTAVMTTPIVVPPVVPVPVLPTTGYKLTPDELRFGIMWGPAFGEFGARQGGDLFRSNEERAQYVADLLRREQGGPGPGTAQPTQLDAHTLTEDDWQFLVRHPEVWKKVAASLYMNQQINDHQAGSGTKYNPTWDESKYRGVLR